MELPFSLDLGMIFVVLVVLIVGLVVFFSIRSSQRDTQKRQAEAAELGFLPTSKNDYPLLLKKIGAIHKQYGKSGIQLRHVFQRQLPDGMIHLFDLWDTSGEDNTELLSHAFLLVRQGPDLPAFMISAMPDTSQMPAMLAGLMQKLTKWMMDKTLPPVVFPPEYGIQGRLQVVSDDPTRMSELLDQSTLARLAGSPGVFLAGKGDSILFSPMRMPVKNNQNEQPTLAQRYNQALDAFRSILAHSA